MQPTAADVLSAWAKVECSNWRDTDATVAGAPVHYVGRMTCVEEHQTSFVLLSDCLVVRCDFSYICPTTASLVTVPYGWFRGKRGAPPHLSNHIVVEILNGAIYTLEYDPYGDMVDVLRSSLEHRAVVILQRRFRRVHM